MSKANVDALIAKIKEEKLIDVSEEGKGKFVEGGLEKLLPEGVTVDQIKAADEAKADITSAVAVVFGSESKALFDKNKDLDKVQFSAKVGRTEITVNQAREVEQTDMKEVLKGNKDAPKIKRQGYVSVSIKTKSSLSSSEINERVSAAWGGLSS